MNSSAFTLAPALALALVLGSPVLAQDRAQDASPAEAGTPVPTEIIRVGDASLTCAQIADEAAGLSEVMGGAPEGGLFSSITNVAKAGAATFIPGAGLVMAGADALTQPDRDRRAAETLAVQNRWYYLNGVYAGLHCHQQAEAVEAPASAQPAVPAQPGATVQPAAPVQPVTPTIPPG